MEAIALLRGKRIILGVCGSVAAYKAVDLASKLTQAGAQVDVIMTAAAQRFVKPADLSSGERPRRLQRYVVFRGSWRLAQPYRPYRLGRSGGPADRRASHGPVAGEVGPWIR